MYTLGFAGTAKNTGKTTTALHMMDLVTAKGYKIALTSIGFDGENTDHITGLPKPRYIVDSGTVIATAASCLDHGSAKYSTVFPTGIKTILGEIVITTIVSPGNVVLAGPNRKADINILLSQLANWGINITFLDGALNRLAAMTMADGLILSTGAAFDIRIPVIANHAQAMDSLFQISRYAGPHILDDRNVMCVNEKHEPYLLPYNSILNENSVESLADWLSKADECICYVPGIFTPTLFKKMRKKLGERISGKQFIFSSPLHLLTSGQPELWQDNFADLVNNDAQVFYHTPVHLNFMTVNPFYPKYLQKTAHYVAEFVDKKELLSSVKRSVKNTLVVDILQPPIPNLLELCNLNQKRSQRYES